MSICAKFQLSSWSRSAWKVCCGGVEHVGTMSNPTKLLLSCFELSWVELRWVLTIILNTVGEGKILYSVSCILYPISCILYPVSCILYILVNFQYETINQALISWFIWICEEINFNKLNKKEMPVCSKSSSCTSWLSSILEVSEILAS